MDYRTNEFVNYFEMFGLGVIGWGGGWVMYEFVSADGD